MAVNSKVITIGIASIKLGNIATDGGMGTALEQLGYTTQGSCKVDFEEAEKTEYNVEEFDDPIHIEHKLGKVSATFQIANPDLDTVQKVFGGTVTGTGANKVYKAPSQFVNIEQSVEIKPKKGLGFKFPRMSISAKFTSDYGKESLFGLEVTASLLQPTKADEPRFSMFEVTG